MSVSNIINHGYTAPCKKSGTDYLFHWSVSGIFKKMCRNTDEVDANEPLKMLVVVVLTSDRAS